MSTYELQNTRTILVIVNYRPWTLELHDYVNLGNVNLITIIFQKLPCLENMGIHKHYISPLLNFKPQILHDERE